jgi:hypothetical protein
MATIICKKIKSNVAIDGVGNPGQKIQVGKPGRKSGWEIRVGNVGEKSGSEIRVGNPSEKSGSEIGVEIRPTGSTRISDPLAPLVTPTPKTSGNI